MCKMKNDKFQKLIMTHGMKRLLSPIENLPDSRCQLLPMHRDIMGQIYNIHTKPII